MVITVTSRLWDQRFSLHHSSIFACSLLVVVWFLLGALILSHHGPNLPSGVTKWPVGMYMRVCECA